MTVVKAKTVSEYINQAPKDVQKKLRELRSILKEAAPKAEESIRWGTPAFSYQRILFTYAVYKKHIGFYPTPAVLQAFEKELASFETGKGSIKFSLDKPLPTALIKRIAKYRVKELKERDAKWM